MNDAPPRVGPVSELVGGATYPRVISYARGMAERHDADDAVSETYAIAWRRLEDMPAGAELGWLIGVARRVLANARRGRRRADALRELIGMQPRVSGPDPAERALDDGLREALRSLRPLVDDGPGTRAIETTTWHAYELLSSSGAGDLVTLRGAHPGARVVRDPGAFDAAMARLYRKG